MTRYFWLVVPLGVGVASARWVALATIADMKDGLIAFLGFLAAALVQMATVTANFLQSDELTPVEAVRLSDSLAKQQRYWMGLLAFTLTSMGCIVLAVVCKDIKPLPVPKVGYNLLLGSIISFVTAFCVVVVAVKTLGLIKGMMSLQVLRAELVLSAAKRRAAEKVEQASTRLLSTTEGSMTLPPGYGAIVHPPKH
ncbi:MAG: hypothetical protein ACTHL8_02610 [Burkholderiaceae bacterium]